MDETAYRSTYKELNPNRCIFEKSITNQRCDCEQKRRFMLASREGIACHSKPALKRCTETLNAIRNNARFTLKVITIDGPMPHNKELRIQVGGMLALQDIVSAKASRPDPDSDSDKTEKPHLVQTHNNSKDVTASIKSQYQQLDVANIYQILENAYQKYGSLDHFPYGEMVKTIVKTKSRPKRQKR